MEKLFLLVVSFNTFRKNDKHATQIPLIQSGGRDSPEVLSIRVCTRTLVRLAHSSERFQNHKGCLVDKDVLAHSQDGFLKLYFPGTGDYSTSEFVDQISVTIVHFPSQHMSH
jgi:hypothetical protein